MQKIQRKEERENGTVVVTEDCVYDFEIRV